MSSFGYVVKLITGMYDILGFAHYLENMLNEPNKQSAEIREYMSRLCIETYKYMKNLVHSMSMSAGIEKGVIKQLKRTFN